MINYRKLFQNAPIKTSSQQGMTILEVILVLAIASSIIFYGYRQYLSFRSDSDILLTRNNVDTIFIAMANYFQAHCNQPPFNNDKTPNQAITVDDLAGYIEMKLPEKKGEEASLTLPRSPLIDYSDPTKSYIMQFNLTPVQSKLMSISSPPKGSTIPVGKIIIWNAQVAIKLNSNNPLLININAERLQAKCLSSLMKGKDVLIKPCDINAKGNYAVWEGLPSMPGFQPLSRYWMTYPIIKQFTQMYTTYPVSVLLTDTKAVENQYYVCGS